MKYLKKIKTEAAKRNISLKQLADSINITEDILKKAIKNDGLSIDQLHIICEKSGIDIRKIFTKKEAVEVKLENNLHFYSNKLFC